jgi:hypothetical protein
MPKLSEKLLFFESYATMLATRGFEFKNQEL